jgi:hypothetical protein
VVTAHDGDETALRATLLALSLSVTGATLRIVHRGRLTSPRQVALRALCEAFAVHTELATYETDEPMGSALAPRPGDLARSAIVFCQSGTVPTEVGWWDRLFRRVRHDPAAIHWRSPSGADALRPVADSVLSGAPVIMAGPRADPALLVPGCDVFTFAGFVGQVLAAAETNARLRPLEDVRFTRFRVDPGHAEAFGDLRVDDAVLSALARARQAGASVVPANPRLLVVGRQPRRQRAAS